MALTKTPIELSSTPSIVDGGNATAITIDSSENTTFAGTITSGSHITIPATSRLYLDGGGNSFIEETAADTVTITTGNTEAMRIDSNQAVGINMNPNGYGQLSVNGTGVVLALRASSGAGQLGFYEGGSGRFYLKSLNGSSGLSFIDGDGSTELGRFSGGNFILGHNADISDAEGDNLQLGNGSGDTGMTFYSGQNGRSTIFFGNAGTNGNVDGFIKYFHETYSTTAVRRGIAIGSGNSTRGFLTNGTGQMIMGHNAAATPTYPGTITAHRTGSASTTTQNTWSFNGNANGYDRDFGFKATGTGDYAYGVINTGETTWMSRLDFAGAIHLTNTTVQSISDRRLKKDIVDANSQWNDIKGLKFKNFKWIDEERGKGTYLGLIADEVESVSPSLVGKDAISAETMPEDGKDPEYKNVKYSIVWMKAVVALQEAMQKIEVLEAKVKALEEA